MYFLSIGNLKFCISPHIHNLVIVKLIDNHNTSIQKMYRGGKVSRWTCVSFSRLRQDGVRRFCDDLIMMCNTIGMVCEISLPT
jgi:hypothetical protein